MKFCLLLFGAICCFGAVNSGFIQAESVNYVHKAATLYNNAKRGVESQDVEKRGCYKCQGAKCPCYDYGLLKAYTNTVGNVVITCQEYRVWNLIIDLAFSGSKRDTNDYYDATCQIMESIGQSYEEYVNSDTCSNVVTSCCEYREYLVAFHCLDVYMMLEDLHLAEYVLTLYNRSADEEKDLLVQHLEWAMLSDCNYIYGSFKCLVKGFLGESCTEEEEEESGEESGEAEESGEESGEAQVETVEETEGETTVQEGETETVQVGINATETRAEARAKSQRVSNKEREVKTSKADTEKRVDSLIEKILKRLNALSHE